MSHSLLTQQCFLLTPSNSSPTQSGIIIRAIMLFLRFSSDWEVTTADQQSIDFFIEHFSAYLGDSGFVTMYKNPCCHFTRAKKRSARTKRCFKQAFCLHVLRSGISLLHTLIRMEMRTEESTPKPRLISKQANGPNQISPFGLSTTLKIRHLLCIIKEKTARSKKQDAVHKETWQSIH